MDFTNTTDGGYMGPFLIPPLGFGIAQGGLVQWDYQDVCFYSGFIFLPFLLLATFALYKCYAELSADEVGSRKRIFILFHVVAVGTLRLAHVLLGPFHTHTLLAAKQDFKLEPLEGVYEYGGVMNQVTLFIVVGAMISAYPSQSSASRVAGLLSTALVGLTMTIHFATDMVSLSDKTKYPQMIRITTLFNAIATGLLPLCLVFVFWSVKVYSQILPTSMKPNPFDEKEASIEVSKMQSRGCALLLVSGFALFVYRLIEAINVRQGMDAGRFRVGEYLGRVVELVVCSTAMYCVEALRRAANPIATVHQTAKRDSTNMNKVATAFFPQLPLGNV
eukprot:c32107_g1_i1.p1 GENE.c32107_g1_i1~~c32107_g1_i1.p1  ORF type:complete len:333 (+),score=65.81 c32107_g1_i1:132-1130(+)